MMIGNTAPIKLMVSMNEPPVPEPDDKQRDQRHLRQGVERGDEEIGDGGEAFGRRHPHADEHAEDQRDEKASEDAVEREDDVGGEIAR